MISTLAKLSALFLVVIAVALLPPVADAQKKQVPWTEWSKKDAEKMLSDSPWAQTQVETNLTEMFYAPTSNLGNAPNRASRGEEGATNQEVNLKYYIRFFSARPVREAFARLFAIDQKLDAKGIEGLQNFTSIKPTNVIILAVNFECADRRYSGKVMQAFNSAVTATLKNSTYLERNDGKRLFLDEYVPPGKDGVGARFIFKRMVDEQPFITDNATEVRFVSEYSQNLKLNMRFKTANMKIDGVLEY